VVHFKKGDIMNNRMKNALEDVKVQFIAKSTSDSDTMRINKIVSFLNEMISDTDKETDSNIEAIINVAESFKHSMINMKRLLKE
jgi:hypothetical protein